MHDRQISTRFRADRLLCMLASISCHGRDCLSSRDGVGGLDGGVGRDSPDSLGARNQPDTQ
jgi:hypothetical protein